MNFFDYICKLDIISIFSAILNIQTGWWHFEDTWSCCHQMSTVNNWCRTKRWTHSSVVNIGSDFGCIRSEYYYVISYVIRLLRNATDPEESHPWISSSWFICVYINWLAWDACLTLKNLMFTTFSVISRFTFTIVISQFISTSTSIQTWVRITFIDLFKK